MLQKIIESVKSRRFWGACLVLFLVFEAGVAVNERPSKEEVTERLVCMPSDDASHWTEAYRKGGYGGTIYYKDSNGFERSIFASQSSDWVCGHSLQKVYDQVIHNLNPP